MMRGLTKLEITDTGIKFKKKYKENKSNKG